MSARRSRKENIPAPAAQQSAPAEHTEKTPVPAAPRQNCCTDSAISRKDALMVVLARKTHRTVGLCRAAVEVVIVWIGWQLGGQVGIGTIVAAVGVGSLFNLNFALLRFNPALLHQENLPETLQRFRERKTIA